MVPYARPEQVVGETWQYTNAWRSGDFKVKSLSQNMRVALTGGQNSDYQDWLLQVGEGAIPVEDELGPNMIRLPSHIMVNQT